MYTADEKNLFGLLYPNEKDEICCLSYQGLCDDWVGMEKTTGAASIYDLKGNVKDLNKEQFIDLLLQQTGAIHCFPYPVLNAFILLQLNSPIAKPTLFYIKIYLFPNTVV